MRPRSPRERRRPRRRHPGSPSLPQTRNQRHRRGEPISKRSKQGYLTHTCGHAGADGDEDEEEGGDELGEVRAEGRGSDQLLELAPRCGRHVFHSSSHSLEGMMIFGRHSVASLTN